MAEQNNSVTLTFGYTNTSFTRRYKIEDVRNDVRQLNGVKEKVLAINASLKAGTDDGLADFFLSDDYDASIPNGVVGKLRRITAAQIDKQVITEIDMT